MEIAADLETDRSCCLAEGRKQGNKQISKISPYWLLTSKVVEVPTNRSMALVPGRAWFLTPHSF